MSGLPVIRCAVIGIGHRTLDDYIPAFAGLSSRVELVAACDVDPSAQARLMDAVAEHRYGTRPRYFADHLSLLDSVDVDLAVVATPHHTHRDITLELCRRAIPVLKEKPFALTVAEARELAAAVRDHEGHLRLCVQRRYHPLYRRAKEALERIGGIRHFDAAYQLSTDAYRDGWRASARTSGGGAIIDMGYHLIDLLHWFFGMPSLVYASAAPKLIPDAEYDIEETTLSTLTYPDGVTGTLRLSLCESKKSELIRIYGSAGHIELTRDRLERYDRSNNVVERVTGARSWDSASGVLLSTLDRLSDPHVTARELKDGVQVTATIESLYRSISQQTSVRPLHEEIEDARFGSGHRRGTAGPGPGDGVSLAEAAIGVV
ncbi:Gfo/Idh/MocA family protein [Streptomyces sp. NPDC059690]|uniref:Gfo/Idh/MocA family protein n=1 Tax=Streptomyces sp. NPDC059690 TaxID=3346907 RepID=UPI003695FF15